MSRPVCWQVVPVASGNRALKDAINEAMRDLVTNVDDTYYLIGSAIGPHPFPAMVRDFQSVIGKEARSQVRTVIGLALLAQGRGSALLPILKVQLYA